MTDVMLCHLVHGTLALGVPGCHSRGPPTPSRCAGEALGARGEREMPDEHPAIQVIPALVSDT